MKNILANSILVLIIASIHINGWAAPSASQLYSRYCSVCHGDRGDSRSRARGSMNPPPKDFTSPKSSIELTRQRMIHSVTEGRPGTAMAAWKTQLSAEQIDAIVDYIRITMMLPAATADSETGGRLYAENCSVCHGDDGRGARWTLTNLKPPPRNFTLPGTADDLTPENMLDVVRFGKADTAMPGFASQLSREDIATVVDYIRHAFMAIPQSSQKVALANQLLPGINMDSPIPKGLQGNIVKGQAYYLQNCSACHGISGDGKGPRAYFILPKPRNFHHAASRHMLNRPKLFEAISFGSRGTDMPAWKTVLTEQQIADLVEYLYQAFIQPNSDLLQSDSPSDKG